MDDNPFVQAHDPDLVDKIRKILSGPAEGKEEQKEKVDGRTKAYRETVKRIEARRTKNTEKSEED